MNIVYDINIASSVPCGKGYFPTNCSLQRLDHAINSKFALFIGRMR